MTLRFAAIGLDHRHIYHHIGELLAAGAECAGYCPETSDPRVVAGVRERFPHLVARNRQALLEDRSIHVVCCAAVPRERASIAMTAMRHGKDVMLDKPGIITAADLAAVERVVSETGRIFSICFSERLVTPSSEIAAQLVQGGAIGRVLQVVGLGPHRMNRAIRPAWFFDPAQAGGILVDIASHQIDQFLFLTGASDARIVASAVANHATAQNPDFQDFGEVLLSHATASAYIRVDWFTPDGLPSWGDGRTVIMGTDGTIELRKNLDIEGRPGTDHVFLADHKGTRHIDASGTPLTYFHRFLADARDRTATAMPQQHVFTVCRLALEAQAKAERRGLLATTGDGA
jgi:predicted dehydrogenase